MDSLETSLLPVGALISVRSSRSVGAARVVVAEVEGASRVRELKKVTYKHRFLLQTRAKGTMPRANVPPLLEHCGHLTQSERLHILPGCFLACIPLQLLSAHNVKLALTTGNGWWYDKHVQAYGRTAFSDNSRPVECAPRLARTATS